MDFKVIISPRAIQDLSEIVRFISFDDAKTAEHFGEELAIEFEDHGFGPCDEGGRARLIQ